MLRFFLFCEERCLAIVGRHFPRLGPPLRRYHRVIKYVIAGGTAAAVDLGLLFVLTDIIGFHYLVSATLAFIVAFVVSFTLQKFWTFGDETRDRIHAQLVLYFVIAVANVFINAGFMYLLVDIFNVWYMLAQIIAGAAIACYNFLIYRRFVFHQRRYHTGPTLHGQPARQDFILSKSDGSPSRRAKYETVRNTNNSSPPPFSSATPSPTFSEKVGDTLLRQEERQGGKEG